MAMLRHVVLQKTGFTKDSPGLRRLPEEFCVLLRRCCGRIAAHGLRQFNTRQAAIPDKPTGKIGQAGR
jgi:hypothetical protein